MHARLLHGKLADRCDQLSLGQVAVTHHLAAPAPILDVLTLLDALMINLA